MTYKRRAQTRRVQRAFGDVLRAQAVLRRIERCPSTDLDDRCDLTIGHIGQTKHVARVLGTSVVKTW